jgi:hypothetical protein
MKGRFVAIGLQMDRRQLDGPKEPGGGAVERKQRLDYFMNMMSCSSASLSRYLRS